jgi:SAM-dependent methyltransferase
MEDQIKYTGLFDFSSYEELVSSMNDVLGRSKEDIKYTLFNEAIQEGTTVKKAAREFGVTPHVYNEDMELFYRNTDAFVFELVVSHIKDSCEQIDRRVIESSCKFSEGSRILCLGDGIGTDALRFAKLGFDVDYFEFKGPSSQFARYRFSRLGLSDEINVINSLKSIPFGVYDIVINREVLEHVPDPRQVIKNIWGYLGGEGVAIVTESFSRVSENFPTHLTSNQQYAGKTAFLFVEEGFRLLKEYSYGRPLVLRKTKKKELGRYTSLISRDRMKRKVRLAGKTVLDKIRP